jgi:hypothetical protein
MINLELHTTASDHIAVNYDGPGYYSSKTKMIEEGVTLVKVCEEYVEKDEAYQFCKLNGYKIVPYLITCCSVIPDNWEINTGCFENEEL